MGSGHRSAARSHSTRSRLRRIRVRKTGSLLESSEEARPGFVRVGRGRDVRNVDPDERHPLDLEVGPHLDTVPGALVDPDDHRHVLRAHSHGDAAVVAGKRDQLHSGSLVSQPSHTWIEEILRSAHELRLHVRTPRYTDPQPARLLTFKDHHMTSTPYVQNIGFTATQRSRQMRSGWLIDQEDRWRETNLTKKLDLRLNANFTAAALVARPTPYFLRVFVLEPDTAEHLNTVLRDARRRGRRYMNRHAESDVLTILLERGVEVPVIDSNTSYNGVRLFETLACDDRDRFLANERKRREDRSRELAALGAIRKSQV